MVELFAKQVAGVSLDQSYSLLDVEEKTQFPINLSIADVRDPSKRQQSFSKTITLPSTKTNDLFFTHAFEVNRSGGFNANIKVPALVFDDNIEIFRGYLRLITIKQDSWRKHGYEVTIYGNMTNIFFDMQKDKLNSLDLSRFDHEYNATNQRNSWDTSIIENGLSTPFSLGNGYVYPLIDYGLSTNQIDYDVRHLYPSVYHATIWDAIFDKYGYTYDMPLTLQSWWESMIVPFTRDRLSLSSDQIADLEVQANRTTDQTENLVVFSNGVLNNKININNIVSDPGGNFDTIQNIYDPNQNLMVKSLLSGKLGIDMTCVHGGSVNLDVPANAAMQVTFQVYKSNGTTFNLAGAASVRVRLDNLPSFTSSYSSTDVINPDPSNIFENFDTDPDNANAFNLITNDFSISDSEYVFANVKATFTGFVGAITFTDGVSNFAGTFDVVLKDMDLKVNIVNAEIQPGNDIELSNVLPDNIEIKSYFSSIIKMFHLYVEVDEDNPFNLIIRPRPDFYSNNTTDLSELLQVDKDHDIKPLGALTAGNYLFTYKADNDYYNQIYFNSYGEIYGQHDEDINNDFLKNENKTEVVFSPTPLADTGFSNMVMPRIFQTEDTGNIKPYAANIRILFYGGMKDLVGQPFNHIDESGTTTTYYQYPYCGHLDDPFNPDYDLNFGTVKEVYYDSLISTLNMTDNNLYNQYYSEYVEEISIDESVVFTGLFNMKPTDISDLSFRKQYYFLESYWKLNKVIDHQAGKGQLTKMEFIKSITTSPFTDGSTPIDGGVDVEPSLGTAVPQNNNTGGSSWRPDIVIKGRNNNVHKSSEGIDITGDDNFVANNCKNVTIEGNGNEIDPALENIVLINTHNTTIEESNVTYIDGKLVDSNKILYREVLEISADSNASLAYEFILMDCSTNDVEVKVTPAANAYNMEYQIIRLDATGNACDIVVGGAGTINGLTKQSLSTQYESITIKSDGNEWFIID